MSGDQAFAGFKYGWLLRGIYAKESSMGRNDGCLNKGLFNGFGYMQSTFMWNCFNSFSDVASNVNNWLDRHLKTMTINQSLCMYNKGKLMDDCDYAESVLALAK